MNIYREYTFVQVIRKGEFSKESATFSSEQAHDRSNNLRLYNGFSLFKYIYRNWIYVCGASEEEVERGSTASCRVLRLLLVFEENFETQRVVNVYVTLEIEVDGFIDT